MIISALLATAAIFSFKGGNDEQLANAVAHQLQQPVVILADARRKWPKVDIEDAEPQQLRSILASSLSTTKLIGEGFAFCTKSWPETLYRYELRSSYDRGFRGKAKVVFSKSNGFISVNTVGGSAPLEELLTEEIVGEAYSWHWFFENVRLQVNCTKIKREAFVQLIAQALGALSEKLKGSVYLALNPKEYRERSIALGNERFRALSDPAGEKYDYLLVATSLSFVADKELSKLMELPGQKATFDMSRNRDFQKAAWKRLEIQYPVNPNDGIKRHPSVAQAWNTVKSLIDPSKPVKLILSSDGMAACHFAGTEKSRGGVVL